ncbi:60 kDa jasmonate-induced protein-like [Rhodamnia argentea]|uniref:rRNA N-glycosylase n=1 Tax=Rhodamnia argentea TaxID=178133 RepID=A0A8B8PUH5_9MYRT|nr:60 kDa jasmonate-induced protein-like [Rhodamnia argentea]XP_030538429.2 60 kDa jasmonate-induced protein-like [Rhodamnia argentea]
MASNPIFTVSFKVDVPKVAEQRPDWATYRHFIEDLRGRLKSEGRYSHNRPVLPLQSDSLAWFHIILQTTTHAKGITLRIRRNNLYLDSYQMENSEQWLEFGRTNDSHLIPGSTFLGFRGDYNDLESTAKRGRDGINLGQDQLTTAVNQLATSTDRRVRAGSPIIVIQMISESIRFDHISNRIAATFSDVLPPEILALENGWGDLSNALLWDDANPVGGFRRLPQPNRMNIRIAEEAAAAIGILLGLPPRVARMVKAFGLLAQGTQGRPLVEVFSVVRMNDTGGKLYGIITVTDGVRSQYIYNKKRDEGDSGLAALLSGPAGCISAYGSFIIDMDLMDDIKGQISRNVYDINNVYDQLLQENVNGEKGSVTVKYAVFRDAVQAIVEVILSNGDGNNPAYVYGQITARNSNFTIESTLFQRTLDEKGTVRPGEPIPLSRSVVAVPLNSSLIVGGNLFVSSEREIAKGTAEFPAQVSGTFEQDISGTYGRIRVKVTWTLDI